MNPHDLSDQDRDVLTVTTRGDQTWITCTSGGQEVTVGPIPTHRITSALPADLMDGGVTAAVIEEEAEQATEKPTADNFAKARFARHPSGSRAIRVVNRAAAWADYDSAGELRYRTDGYMALEGWVPVRECPDPEVHEGRGDDDHSIPWKTTALNWRARAEKAERAACPDRDVHWRYDEVEKERDEWRVRAEAAEPARDKWREVANREQGMTDELSRQLEATEASLREVNGVVKSLRAAQPRLLTPEDITADAYERGVPVLRDAMGVEYSEEILTFLTAHEAVRAIVAAVLTEPPTRPEGAEELETVIGLNAGRWTSGAEDVRALADLLASRGVRVERGVR